LRPHHFKRTTDYQPDFKTREQAKAKNRLRRIYIEWLEFQQWVEVDGESRCAMTREKEKDEELYK
jgi:hypothetical protein